MSPDQGVCPMLPWNGARVEYMQVPRLVGHSPDKDLAVGVCGALGCQGVWGAAMHALHSIGGPAGGQARVCNVRHLDPGALRRRQRSRLSWLPLAVFSSASIAAELPPAAARPDMHKFVL